MAFEYLAEHATFQSVEDMDLNIKMHIDKYRLALTTSERAIIFMIAGRSLMYPGASHLKAETIADKTNTSRSTVMRGIKKLISLNIIEKVTQTKLNGIKGASIYKISPYDDTSNVTQREDVIEASNDVTCPPQSENLSIKSFNLLSSKQAKNNLYDLENELREQEESKKAYMNEYQEMLFDFMHSLPMHDSLKDELHKVVLATEMNNAKDFVKAKNVLFNIVSDIAAGTLTISRTLRSTFVGAYNKSNERTKNLPSITTYVEKEPHVSNPVNFYNWLSELENDGLEAVIQSKNKHCPNWLKW